ncbi:MAG: hypothetical protein WCB12_20800 [Bryobacteraceae bacterium]
MKLEGVAVPHRATQILICTVGGHGPACKPIENRDRFVALKKLLDAAKERRAVDLVVLPGGYFFAAQENPDEMPLLREIWAAIEERSIAVCFGVDTGHKRPNNKKAVKEQRLPSHGFAWTPERGHVGPWRQRSTSRLDQRDMSPDLANEERYIRVGTQRVALLMCGELFNPKLRSAVQAQGITVAVDMAHTGRGFRFAGAAKRWSSAKPIKAVLMSCHAERVGAAKRWSVAGKYKTARSATVIVDAPVRIEGLVVSVP